MSRYWFRPHTHGYGATPADWKGWLATAVFVSGLGMLSALFAVAAGGGPAPALMLTWALDVLALAACFIALAYAKTDGQWRWRWGE